MSWTKRTPSKDPARHSENESSWAPRRDWQRGASPIPVSARWVCSAGAGSGSRSPYQFGLWRTNPRAKCSEFFVGGSTAPAQAALWAICWCTRCRPIYDSEEAMPDRLDALLVARIVTVNDDVAGVELDPVANLSIEAVHRRLLTGGAVPVIKTVTLPRRFHPVR